MKLTESSYWTSNFWKSNDARGSQRKQTLVDDHAVLVHETWWSLRHSGMLKLQLSRCGINELCTPESVITSVFDSRILHRIDATSSRGGEVEIQTCCQQWHVVHTCTVAFSTWHWSSVVSVLILTGCGHFVNDPRNKIHNKWHIILPIWKIIYDHFFVLLKLIIKIIFEITGLISNAILKWYDFPKSANLLKVQKMMF